MSLGNGKGYKCGIEPPGTTELVLTRLLCPGGLGIPCLSRDQKFEDSNPLSLMDFFNDVNVLSTISPGGTINYTGPESRNFQA